MDKIGYIQSLRQEDTETLRQLVEEIWSETDSFSEFLMFTNSKEQTKRLITARNLPEYALEIGLHNGSYSEEDKWVGTWNQDIFSMSDSYYQHWLLEICYSTVFRQALIDCSDLILKNRTKFPSAVISYVATNQQEKQINNEEDRKRFKRIVPILRSEY